MAASFRREPCPYCRSCRACAHYPAYANGFSARVALAARCLRNGEGLGSRAFDNCFEMGDGDAVVAAILRMAESDPLLSGAVARFWHRSDAQAALAAARERYAHVPTARLQYAASQERHATTGEASAQLALL